MSWFQVWAQFFLIHISFFLLIWRQYIWMNALINFIAGRMAHRPTCSFLFGQCFACFSTGVYRSSLIFIQGYIPIMFQLYYSLIIYYSKVIYIYTYFIAVARKRNQVKVNISLRRIKVHSEHLLQILGLLICTWLDCRCIAAFHR